MTISFPGIIQFILLIHTSLKKSLLLLVLLVSFGTTFSQTLLAHYPFNGNATNSVGTPNGAFSGSVLTTDRQNLPASAYSFDGINDNINLGNSAAIRPTAALTVSVWFELNTPGVLDVDHQTTILGKIVNASILEYTYDDN